ncbi:unnamed protein product, partial [Prunus brigantina]
YKFFYELTERDGSQFRVCLARPFPLFLKHNLSIIPDGEMENDLREIWGSFLVARDLHCGLSKAGAEVYLPHFVARQFGLIQTAPLPPLSINRLSSWRPDVAQQHGMAGISFQLAKGMTFLTLRPWMCRNAIDEDGRAGKTRKASVAPLRLTMPAAGGSRVTASPSARPAAAVLTAASTPRAPVAAGARRTLAQRTVPLTSPAQPVAAGRKRGRDTAGAEGVVVEAAPVREVVVETAPPPRPRKRALLVFLEGEDEGDVPPAVVSEAPPVAEELAVEEEAAEEVPASEKVVQEAADIEETTEARVEEEAEEEDEEEDEEMIEAEERPGTEETVVELSDSEVPTEEQAQTAPVEVPAAVITVPTSTATAPARPSPSIPRRGPGISSAVEVSSYSLLPLCASYLVISLIFAYFCPPEAASPDDLESLFASLHEEVGSSALAPLDEDYKVVLERLWEFLLCDAYQMTTAEAFIEFRACLDEAMAMGLLDSAQLDEL